MLRPSSKKTNGQSLVETLLGIMVLIPILLLVADFAIVFFAVQSNDAKCRNAVRAAAAGKPEEAILRARAIIGDDSNRKGEALISGVDLLEPIEVKIEKSPVLQTDPDTGETLNPGGPLLGTAVASTQIKIRTFLLHLAYGGRLPLTFRSTQSCPISYVMPPNRVGPASKIE